MRSDCTAHHAATEPADAFLLIFAPQNVVHRNETVNQGLSMSANNDRSEELQNHHNQGQKDYSDGKYDIPHKVEEQIFVGPKTFEKQTEDNDAYNQGYRHAREQN
jgi:hypothetical protein